MCVCVYICKHPKLYKFSCVCMFDLDFDILACSPVPFTCFVLVDEVNDDENLVFLACIIYSWI